MSGASASRADASQAENVAPGAAEGIGTIPSAHDAHEMIMK